MKQVLRSLLACVTLLGTPGLSAQNLTASTTTSYIGQQNHVARVTFTPGADSGGFEFVLNYDSTEPASVTTTPGSPSPDITATVANGTISCSATASFISCTANATTPSVDLGPGTVSILFDAGLTSGTSALTFAMAAFFDQQAGTENGTTTNGAVVISTNAPLPPGLSFDPASGGSLVMNASGTASVAVTAGFALFGGNTALACTSTNGIATVTGSPFTANAVGSINVRCIPVSGAAVNFTVTCTIDPSEGTDQTPVSFNGVCPSSQVLSVPAVGSFGKGIMIALLAGLGVLGFAMRRAV